MVRGMFDLMYEANGVGLAANQVDLPFRMFVVNLAANPEEGEESVFINPVISGQKGPDEQEEGCLSLPGLYAQVKRSETITVNAFNLQLEEISAQFNGMMARVVQHETDHLDGVLFIDRLSETGSMAAKESLEEFEIEFDSRRETKEIPGDEEIAARLAALERKYC